MSQRTQTYYALYEMFEVAPRQPNTAQCPVCVLVLQSVDRYLQRMTAEGTASVPDRLAVRAAGGWCNRHTACWAALRENLPTALYFADFAKALATHLTTHTPGGKGGRGGLFGTIFNPNSPEAAGDELDERQAWHLGLARCTACGVQAENEPRILDDFVYGTTQPDFRAVYAASYGICLPHTVAALRQSANPNSRRTITETETAHLRQLEADLRAVQDKSNAVEGQHKTFGDEIHALARAVWKSAGVAGLR